MSAPTGRLPSWVGNWSPTTERWTGTVEAHPVAGLAALLDVEPEAVHPGRPLPACWHWAALSQWPSEGTVAQDGHPHTGSFLPTTPFPRRMWTGSDIEIHRAPVIGESVSVERSVTAVVEKTGRRGAFALVTVGTVLRVNSQPAVTESVKLAYLPANPSAATDSIPMLEPAQPRIASWLRREDAWCWRMQPDPVVLMWFSALTANPHRIHYDRSYARYVEGHPDLLVQGPLMALVLAEVGRRERPDATVMNVSCRARRPLTVGTAARTRLTSPPDSETMQVELVPGLPDDTGQAAYMTGEVRYG